MRRHTPQTVVAIAWLFTATACAAYRQTPPLAHYDLTKGYRFDSLPLAPADRPRNSDDIFVVLAFSGGGTRAAALSYGVLDQLRHVKFHLDSSNRPVACTPATSPECVATERTLLDEVDVISSVSGGSFTSAYYALNRERIFDPTSSFHTKFLYHPVQGDLLRQATYYPSNWKRLRSRIEIAAEYYANNIFGQATFKALERKSRPYLILNATDASTGARFEFTQEQFDLLCADLSQVPIARGVAASSAFPGLLNSMTIDSYNARGCGYNGPDSTHGWVDLAFRGGFASLERLTAARRLIEYRDPRREHLHLLDGGLADNIGVRSILQSLHSTDIPTAPGPNGTTVSGGWSLVRMMDLRRVKKIIVITVDARTNRRGTADRKKTGPGSLGVLVASPGIPMGNYSTESLTILRDYAKEAELDHRGEVEFWGVEIAFGNLTNQQEREYMQQTGTNFQLTRHQVDCLIDRGSFLLRQSMSVTEPDTTTSFEDFVHSQLKGTIEPTSTTARECTAAGAKKQSEPTRHTLDVAAQYSFYEPESRELTSTQRLSVGLRVSRPNGLGATLGYTAPRLRVRSTTGGREDLGKLVLRSVLVGGFLARHAGPIEASAGVAAGVGWGSFSLANSARERFAADGSLGVKAHGGITPVVKPGVNLWWELWRGFAVTGGAAWLWARPKLDFSDGAPESDRRVQVRTYQLSAGLGYRLY